MWRPADTGFPASLRSTTSQPRSFVPTSVSVSAQWLTPAAFFGAQQTFTIRSGFPCAFAPWLNEASQDLPHAEHAFGTEVGVEGRLVGKVEAVVVVVLEAAVVEGVLEPPQAPTANTKAAPSMSAATFGLKPLTPALTAGHGSPAPSPPARSLFPAATLRSA
jgi:hypothetical protein